MKKTLCAIALIMIILCLLAACEKECAHEYQAQITKAATCTAEGVQTLTCTLCDHSYTQPIPFLEHTYDTGTVVKAATCAEEGSIKSVCTGCGQTKIDSIETLPHTLGESAVTKEPNCTEEGERNGTCTVCGASEVVEKIPTNDVHIFENIVIREATCTDPGEGTNVCSLCQYSEPCEYELKAHSYVAGEVTKKPTCTAKGTQKYTCSMCSGTKEETLTANGHKWAGATCTKASICSICDAVGSKADHNYEILSERGDGQHFAKQVDKKCKTCGLAKTLYYAGQHEFDLEAIYKELEDYAKSYGLNVTNSFDGLPYYQQIQKVNATVLHSYLNIVGDSGPENLIRRGKAMIDKEYSHVKNSIHPMSTYTIHLKVSYGQSASMGLGSFSVQVTLTSAKTE